MSASRRSLAPDRTASADPAQHQLSQHASPASSASYPGFGNWEVYCEREQETVIQPIVDSAPNPAEALAPATALRPDGVQLDSHRGSLTTDTDANDTAAPGIFTNFHKFSQIFIENGQFSKRSAPEFHEFSSKSLNFENFQKRSAPQVHQFRSIFTNFRRKWPGLK